MIFRKTIATGAISLGALSAVVSCANTETTETTSPDLGVAPASTAPAVPGRQVDPGALQPVGTTMYATAELNVRTGPGTGHGRVATLTYGAQVETTGAIQDGWVELRDPAGWVAGEYLSDTVPAQPVPAPTSEPADTSSVPAEHRAALRQADMYANQMHMSEAGLYDQLTSEYGGQFPADAAQYAVDNVQSDWDRNALESAKTYRELMSMSDEAIRDQLTSEYGGQFTAGQADYAIRNLP